MWRNLTAAWLRQTARVMLALAGVLIWMGIVGTLTKV